MPDQTPLPPNEDPNSLLITISKTALRDLMVMAMTVHHNASLLIAAADAVGDEVTKVMEAQGIDPSVMPGQNPSTAAYDLEADPMDDGDVSDGPTIEEDPS